MQDNRYLNLISILLIFLIAFIFSKNKKKISLRLVGAAFLMQILLAVFVLKTGIGNKIFEVIAQKFSLLYSFADAGIKFIFGNLADTTGSWGMIFAVKVVPIIIFFGALMSLLFHLGVIQFFVKIVSYLIIPILGTSGAESLCAAANSMLGPTEAPLLIKKYLKGLTESEMLVVMVSGMSTLSASILAVYGSMGISMKHMLASSIMSVPASLLIAKIMIPETNLTQTGKGSKVELEKDSANILDAISVGTGDGLRLAANIAAMLISFISIMAMIDYILLNTVHYSLNDIFAKVFYYVAYMLGIGSQDRNVAGALLGQKLVINEFIAYVGLAKIVISEKAKIILTYALCGFSNFSVIGIMIGGIGALEPSQRSNIIKLGFTALLGGTLVNLLNASIAALLL